MNSEIKKLISLLSIETRTTQVNTLIGYLNTLEVNGWSLVISKLIEFDLAILDIYEEDKINKSLIYYSIILNNCYQFINEEHPISFINQSAFINNKVINITKFDVFVLARRTFLKQYS